MRPYLKVPIRDWPSLQFVTYKFEESAPLLRTLTLAWANVPESVDAVVRTFNECYCETGRRPRLLLLGWRTYLEFSWYATRDNFCPIDEWDGTPVLCDPSRENMVRAIEHRDMIGGSKGPFCWEKFG